MVIKNKQIEKINKFKENGWSIYKTAKKLNLAYNTIKKYWNYSPPPKPEKKPEPLPETPPQMILPCPSCETMLIFLKTEKRIQCPFCEKIHDVIQEDDNHVMRDKPLGETKFPRYLSKWDI